MPDSRVPADGEEAAACVMCDGLGHTPAGVPCAYCAGSGVESADGEDK